MTRKMLLGLAVLFLLSSSAFSQVPATVHAVWSPNPATDNVVQYTVTLDTAAPVVLLATACNTTCSQALTIPTFGSHTVTLIAQNLSFDGVTLQSSPPATVTFTLGAAPAIVAGLHMTK